MAETLMAPPPLRIVATVLGCSDPGVLASFYERLLGWSRVTDKPNWVTLRPPSGGTGLSFQREENYVAPVWPTRRGHQQIMMHLDIAVEDLGAAVAWAVQAGAAQANRQPQDRVRVMLDPAGHPFCLFLASL